MKKFLYGVIVLLIFLPLYGAAQVGFKRVGFVSNVPDNSKKYYAVAIDSQGRIIAVGTTDLDDGLIARYLPNGTLDTTFNQTGFINQEDGNSNSREYYAVTLDTQGRIIAVGRTDNSDGLIARYLPDGTLDTTFNEGSVNGAPGFINQEDGNSNSRYYYDVTVDAQGRIIVVGDTDNNDGLIARYLPDGTLDTNFNAGSVNGAPGYINQEGNTNSFSYYSVTIDSQDRIIAVGLTGNGDALIVRYLPEGTLDTNFNAGSVNGAPGYINQEGNTNSIAYYSVTLDKQGRIIVVGETDNNDGLIARYLPDGTLDTTFNANSVNGAPGYINQEGNTDSRYYYDVIVDAQGRIIVVGGTDNSDGLIARYLPNGTLDTTFNQTGFINTEGMTNSFYYRSFTLDLQGRIIVVGHTDDDNGLIVRYLANGVLDAESNWNTNNYRESANINNISIGLLG